MTDNRIKAANDATEAARKAAEEQEESWRRRKEAEARAAAPKAEEYEQQRMELIQQSVQTMTALFSGMEDYIKRIRPADKRFGEIHRRTNVKD